MNNNNPYPIAIANLYEPKIIYKMPLYQRQYCWKPTPELSAFKEDISKIYESITSADPENVFLGAVVLQSSSNVAATQSRVMTVIDGQQRITTIFLTIAALSEYSYEKGWDADAKIIIENHLRSNGVTTRDQPILEPTNLDTNQFYEIISSLRGANIVIPTNGSGEKEGDLTIAYDFIYKKIVTEFLDEMDGTKNTFDEFLNCFLNNFVIADINLSESHNPNEVFDRLNQRGQRLGVIDLIRNDCFKTYFNNAKGAESFYKKHWMPFENRLKTIFPDIKYKKKGNTDSKILNEQVDNFFYPFAVNKQYDIRKRNLLRALDDSWGNTTPEDKVAEMDEYISSYFTWLIGTDVTERINKNYKANLRNSIINLKQFNAPRSALPFLMRCLLEVDKGNLSENKASECFDILESFFVRRAIVNEEEGTGYDQIFKRLWEDCKGDPGLLKIKMPTRTKTFPDDAQFKHGIETTGIYGKRLDKYLLFQYEKDLAKQSLEVYPNQHIFTTDHINPQTIKGLNAQQREEHKRTLHLWGNLLPMSKKLNSSKSNRKLSGFRGELKLKSRFETTHQFITYFQQKNEWEPQWIDQRTVQLANWALGRWKPL